VSNPPDIAILFGRPGRSDILAEKLRARGFRITLYNNHGIPGTYVPLRFGLLPILSRILSTRHQIYLTPLSFVPSLCLALNRGARGIPCVLNATGLKSATYRDRSMHWTFPWLAERWFYPTLMDRVLAGGARIVCNSQYLQRRLGSEFPQYAHKMMTIYNGIEFNRYTSGRPISIEGIPPDAPKLLSVTTWNYEGKAIGAKLLIDAMEMITDKHPEVCLIIAAKIAHPRYAQEIENYLARKPQRKSIKLFYNQSNIPDLLASSDLFVYATPESVDSLPRALLEAHAAGLPIVSTATAGCPEVVEDSITGFLVPNDAEIFANRMIDLLAHPEKRREMGIRGRDRVRKLFDWDGMAEGYANLFHGILSNQK
jgi:glycosyltransferase involved in cell wall biosynthesis